MKPKSKVKDGSWRITVRLEPGLQAKVERAARKKRWSLNTFIEESLIEAVADYESK